MANPPPAMPKCCKASLRNSSYETHSKHHFTRLLTTFPQGATASVVSQYKTVSQSPEWTNPVAWTSPSFSLDDYNLVFLPGGHEKSVRQVIDSAVVHKLLLDFFPKTKKPSSKAVGAVCHGVMVLSEAKGEDGRSAIHDAVTTTLPARFEQVAFWGTRAFLGDYYKTYGACSADVEESVSISWCLGVGDVLTGCRFVRRWMIQRSSLRGVLVRDREFDECEVFCS